MGTRAYYFSYTNSTSGSFRVVAGGCSNTIDISADYSFIGGGELNQVTPFVTDACYSFVGGGYNNAVCDSYSVIFGGCNNTVTIIHGFIGGGSNNMICSVNVDLDYAIMGGDMNKIFDCAGAAFIGGGFSNCISCPSATDQAFFNGILGGSNNCITKGCHSVILGGCNNFLCGNHSAVLGGDGNCDNGFDCVGLTGINVYGVWPNAFHANNYIVTDMYDGAGSRPILPCQLYFCRDTFGNCPVFICL